MLRSALTIGVLFMAILPALAQAAPLDRKAAADRHRKMSDLHKEVAACLDSSRPVAECHQIMAAECPNFAGGGRGGMRGHMMGRHGAMPGCPLFDIEEPGNEGATPPAQPKK